MAFFPDLLPALNGRKAEINTEDFLQEIFDILVDYIKKSNDRSNKILDFHHPDQILESMDFSLPEKPQPLDQIFVDCKDTLKYQVKTGHPRFMNQLSQGLDIVSMAGEWLAATANTNMFTYEIAPVFIMMEHEVKYIVAAAQPFSFSIYHPIFLGTEKNERNNWIRRRRQHFGSRRFHLQHVWSP